MEAGSTPTSTDSALLAELADAMTVTMRDAPGVGLAAPQIGLPLSFYVVEDPFAAEDHRVQALIDSMATTAPLTP